MTSTSLPRPLFAGLAAGLLFTAACTTLAPLEFPPDGGGCQSDDACQGDRICVAGACVQPDHVSPPPDGGAVDGGGEDGGGPDGGIDPPPAPGDLGGACQRTADCLDPGALCIQDLPGGYCAIPGCDACPPEGVCVVNEAGEPICLDGCSADPECRPGYACADPLGALACVPALGGGDSPVGGACSTAADCQSIPSRCFTDWPDGYCAHGDCESCPAGSACVRTRNFAACLASCQTDADCRPEYLCLEFRREQICFPRER